LNDKRIKSEMEELMNQLKVAEKEVDKYKRMAKQKQHKLNQLLLETSNCDEKGEKGKSMKNSRISKKKKDETLPKPPPSPIQSPTRPPRSTTLSSSSGGGSNKTNHHHNHHHGHRKNIEPNNSSDNLRGDSSFTNQNEEEKEDEETEWMRDCLDHEKQLNREMNEEGIPFSDSSAPTIPSLSLITSLKSKEEEEEEMKQKMVFESDYPYFDFEEDTSDSSTSDFDTDSEDGRKLIHLPQISSNHHLSSPKQKTTMFSTSIKNKDQNKKKKKSGKDVTFEQDCDAPDWMKF